MTETLLLTTRSLRLALRNPVWLAVSLSMPLLYLGLFAPLLKHYITHGNVLDEFLPGILALMAFVTGSSQGFTTIFELHSGVVERFRVTPASRLAILVAPIIANMLMMFCFDALLVAVGAVFGFHVHLLGLGILGVLLGAQMLMWAAFSVGVALVTKEISAFAAVINGLNLPVLLLAGVLLQISTGPAWMRLLAHFDPVYYVVQASRSLASGSIGAGDVWQAFAVVVPLCALILAWATRTFRTVVA